MKDEMFNTSLEYTSYPRTKGDFCFVQATRFYIPVLFLTTKDHNQPVLFWYWGDRFGTGSYAKIFSSLRQGTSTMIFRERKDVNIYTSRGCITDEQKKIHFLVTVNRGTNHFRLYLSREFIDPTGRFKNICRKFMKEFILDSVADGVQLCVVEDINALYKDNPRTTEFDSFEDEIKYLNSLGSLLVDETVNTSSPSLRTLLEEEE